VKDDWSFTLPRAAGRWSFEAWLEHPGPAFQRLPVKAVLAGRRGVTHSSVNFSSGAEVGDIEIVLSTTKRGGVLAGSVDDGDRPASDYGVIAFSADMKDWAGAAFHVTCVSGVPIRMDSFGYQGCPRPSTSSSRFPRGESRRSCLATLCQALVAVCQTQDFWNACADTRRRCRFPTHKS
jgi:hypothetical protein